MKKLIFSKEELLILIPIVQKGLDEVNTTFKSKNQKITNYVLWLETFKEEVKSGEATVRPITRAQLQGFIQAYLLNTVKENRIRFLKNGFKDHEIEAVRKIDLYVGLYNKVIKRGVAKKSLIINPFIVK